MGSPSIHSCCAVHLPSDLCWHLLLVGQNRDQAMADRGEAVAAGSAGQAQGAGLTGQASYTRCVESTACQASQCGLGGLLSIDS